MTFELVPDMTVVEFLKAIKSRYNLAIYFKESVNTMRMQYREQISLKTDYDDITPIASNVKSINEARISGYRLEIDKEDGDALSEREFIEIGTVDKTIKLAAGRLFHTTGNPYTFF